MRPAIPAAVLILLAATAAGAATPRPAAETEAARAPARTSAIIVAPFFQRVVEDLLESSGTLRGQYDRILGTPRVLVWVEPLATRFDGRSARATITRAASGLVLARVQLATPLRSAEYAEMLAHELEHVLEQIEGVNLSTLAAEPGGKASLLYDGSYETERARRAGRAAAREIERHADAPRP